MTDSLNGTIPAGVTGTDGIVPVMYPDSQWRQWALAQLYLGAAGDGRFVGKVNDYVCDYTTDEWWIIAAVDPTTLIPTLKPIRRVISPADPDTKDLLMADGPGDDVDTFRIYYDKSTLPYKLTVEGRCYVNAVLATYCKIFRGSKTEGTDEVISAFYDASGNFLGDSVPLDLIDVPNAQNYARKAPQPCYTKKELAAGERLTCVMYDDAGGPLSIRPMIVQNTTWLRSVTAPTKYITGIALESPWLSESDPNTLRYPLNVPLNGLNMFGVVQYSDGSKLRMPVDGTKFQVLGLENYVATVVGEEFEFTIQYNLSPDEAVYDAQTGTPTGKPFKSEIYKAVTLAYDGSYEVKLYCVPVYMSDVQEYRLEWYLYNLDRDLAVNVTPYVTFATNSRGFQPGAPWGTNQSLQVNLDLNQVNGAYRKWIHTQTLGLILYRPATDFSGTPWAIQYDLGQNPPYGLDLKATARFVNQNLKYLNIGQGLTDKEAWLEKVLAPARPLYNSSAEATYPEPNMFSFVQTDGTELEFPIDTSWNQDLMVSTGAANADTLRVRFFKRTNENDIEIALCPMVIEQTN